MLDILHRDLLLELDIGGIVFDAEEQEASLDTDVLFDLIVGIFCAGGFIPVAGENGVVNEVLEHSSVERMCRVIMIKLGKLHLLPTISTDGKPPINLKLIPLNFS